jgi:hypothetical protein
VLLLLLLLLLLHGPAGSAATSVRCCGAHAVFARARARV